MSGSRILVVSEPRTGSNNLLYSLSAHPTLELGNELLHPVNGLTRDEAGMARLGEADEVFDFRGGTAEERRRFLDAVFERYDGFKIHTEHVDVEDIVAIASDYDCLVVRCLRLSLFEQAVSNFVAIARSVWHADEQGAGTKMAGGGPYDIDATRFVQWIDATWSRRQQLTEALAQPGLTVCEIDYEMFFSSVNVGLTVLNEILSRSGRPRLGQLTVTEEREKAYATVMHYLDTSTQKLTPEAGRDRLVSNMDELERRFVRWRLSVLSGTRPAIPAS